MFHVLALDDIARAGLDRFPSDRYRVGFEMEGGEALEQAVEEGKRRFDGFELPGRVRGVIGLGAVGVRVANAVRALGMEVIGYDPQLTLSRAWELSSEVGPATPGILSFRVIEAEPDPGSAA